MKYKMGSFLLFFVFLLNIVVINSQTYWLEQASPTQKELTKSLFFDSEYGWVIGDSGTVIRTTNSGSNWAVQQTGIFSSELKDITFISRNTGWILAVDSTYKTFILHTTNSGVNWSTIYYPDTTVILSTIFFNDQFTGFVSGFNGEIYRTTNSGANWKTCNIDTTSCLYLFPKNDILFINSQTGYVCGGVLDLQGVFIKTTDAGSNWFSMCISAEPMNEIVDLGGGRVAVMGGDYDLGSIFAISSNYGSNWIYEPTGCFGNATSFAFRTPGEVWAALSFSGMLAVNLDSMKPGSQWQCINSPGNIPINSIKFLSPVLGYAFGEQGKIYKYNQNVIGVQNNQLNPGEFSLRQNYPNPFNPVTNIKFQIPASVETSRWDVLVSIYDALGREAAVLVNQQMQPGTYELSWDASNYPSGVYYYRLEVVNEGDAAATFTETRKMVLLK